MTTDEIPQAAQPYLIHARWQLWNFRHGANEFRFHAQGFGRGDMTWKVPRAGRFQVQVRQGNNLRAQFEATAGEDGLLVFEINAGAIEPVEVTVTQGSNSP